MRADCKGLAVTVRAERSSHVWRISVRVLAELAGRSSIAVTQRYIDVNDEQMANAVELL